MSERMYYRKERDYLINFSSLKPLTTYYFYVNKVKITNYVKQYGKKIGDSLITDIDGKIRVVFYFNSGIDLDTPQKIPYKVESLHPGPLEIVLTTVNQSSLPFNYSSISSSLAIFYI